MTLVLLRHDLREQTKDSASCGGIKLLASFHATVCVPEKWSRLVLIRYQKHVHSHTQTHSQKHWLLPFSLSAVGDTHGTSKNGPDLQFLPWPFYYLGGKTITKHANFSNDKVSEAFPLSSLGTFTKLFCKMYTQNSLSELSLISNKCLSWPRPAWRWASHSKTQLLWRGTLHMTFKTWQIHLN